MNLITKTIFAMAICLGVVACGGGGSSDSATSSVSADTSGSSQITTLTTTDTVVGTGATTQTGDSVTVNYTGWLYDVKAADKHGTQFDSSVGGTPFTFTLGAGYVIAGWDQGVAGMKVGGKRTLIIPSSLGYGATGSGAIPPNAALVFDIELVSIN